MVPESLGFKECSGSGGTESGSLPPGGPEPFSPSKTSRASTMANSPGKGLGLGAGPGAARTTNAPRRARMRIERTFIMLRVGGSFWREEYWGRYRARLEDNS